MSFMNFTNTRLTPSRRAHTSERVSPAMHAEGAFLNVDKTIVLRSIVTICIAAAFFATASGADRRHVGRLAPGDFFWKPELAPGGPVVMIISLPDQTLSAYRNGIRALGAKRYSEVARRGEPFPTSDCTDQILTGTTAWKKRETNLF